MTKEAAIEAMEQGGYKVSHSLFSDSEYIGVLDDEYYIDEKGLCLPQNDFWNYRQGEVWETGWKIVG